MTSCERHELTGTSVLGDVEVVHYNTDTLKQGIMKPMKTCERPELRNQ